MTMIFLLIFLYAIVVGVTFPVLGNKVSPHNYWESPGPFFGSLAWPLCVPVLVGGVIGRRIIAGHGKESKRAKEIAAAEHRLELARINARTTAELERAIKS